MSTQPSRFRSAKLVMALLVSAPAWADWAPASGQWGKTDRTDLRVMTFNIEDAICRNALKSELNGSAGTPWHAVVRIVAAMRPDVLILQEAADNSGNGTSGGCDSVEQLTVTLNLFLHGGTDPFSPGGPVGAYVQNYAPDYDLPYIFVSTISDGYNRNVILSRFPFIDLNGDGRSQLSDIPLISNDLYAPGGTGGIRGFMFAEIDLPNITYTGDLVMGCAHLRSGSSASDKAERFTAGENVGYYIDYLLNGAGTGTPDPHSKILDSPAATSILPPSTPVVMGGDWNEDENTNGRRGPADWLTQAATLDGTDGTDRDRTDMTYDDARNPYTNQRGTISTTTKFDYVAWQDSIATIRRAFVFNTGGLLTSYYPPEVLTYPDVFGMSSMASDHWPVIADLILPQYPPPCRGDCNCDGVIDFADIDYFVAAIPSNQIAWRNLYMSRNGGALPPCSFAACDVDDDGVVGFADIEPFVALIPSVCP